MSETLLTKCPHCSTTFRLTQAQLQIAGGAVRCGACYQVFHANEHIVKTAVVEELRAAPPPRPDPVEEAFELDSDEGLDPYDTGDFDLNSPDADLFSEDYQHPLDASSSLDEFGFAEAENIGKKKGVDESWAEDLLKELGDEPEDDDGLIHDEMDSKSRKPTISSSDNAFALDDDFERPPPTRRKKTGDDLSDTFRTLGSFSSDDPFAIADIDDEDSGSPDHNDESWAKAMLDELEQDEAPPQQPEGLAILKDEPAKPSSNPFAARELASSRQEALNRAKSTEQPKPKAPKKAASPADGLRNSETEEFFRLLEEPLTTTGASSAKTVEPSLQLADLDDLDDLEDALHDTAAKPERLFKDADNLVNQQVKISALRYAEDEPKSNRGRNLLLILGVLVLALAGVAQYVYFNFDSVARTPQWRPLLEQLCGVLDCRLPSQVNLDAIVGTNLVVRSHPHERNALVIDVIIKNRAPFEQPFPAVQLNFQDTNGTPVAGRRFQPVEYIHDPGIDFQRMPPETPIHLTLEIVDPGSRAAGYMIEFLSADPLSPQAIRPDYIP